jgi:tetratricopeptide (TPR) repeat protein
MQVEPPVRQAALANRAACRLALQQYEAAAQDCDEALLQLLLEAAGRPCGLGSLHGWVLAQRQLPGEASSGGGMDWGRAARLLGRRGAALGHLKRYQAAARDYECAAHVCGALLGEPGQAALLEEDRTRMKALLVAEAEVAA